MTTRRQFMLGSLGLGGLASLGAFPGRAGAATPNRLVVYFAYGGWDPTYLFDAKPDSDKVDTPSGDWITHGNLTLWDTGNMSASHDFLAEWNDRIAVVNGVSVNSLVHEECARRLLTGTSAAKVPDVASLVASQLGSERPVPYFTLGANARTHGLEAQAATLGWSNQLQSLVTPELAWPTDHRRLAPSADQDADVQAYLRQRAQQLGAVRTSAGSNAIRLADYAESLDRAEQIRAFAPGSFLEDYRLFTDYDISGHAAAALAEGFSQTVFMSDQGYWDTHSGNSQQSSLFNGLFRNLADLMDALVVAGIADDTLVLVVSEMGRTPLINSLGGKDHWPFTSTMLIGTSVESRVVAATDSTLRQVPVDTAGGEVSDGGRALQTSDILATVTQLVGLDPSEHYPDAEVLHAVVA
jgi:hypothetical protein